MACNVQALQQYSVPFNFIPFSIRKLVKVGCKSITYPIEYSTDFACLFDYGE